MIFGVGIMCPPPSCACFAGIRILLLMRPCGRLRRKIHPELDTEHFALSGFQPFRTG
ncbi:hypothetical protein SCH4B_0430 [Ruegeria sp. TrichCH4B]|nr:hypothetical protein SCH4B_0430 [Ruegeria sp. TrichCH4B]